MEILESAKEALSGTTLSFSPSILWVSFMLVFLVFLFFSIILFYHWRKYDWSNNQVKKISAVYIVGAAAIFILDIIIISLIK